MADAEENSEPVQPAEPNNTQPVIEEESHSRRSLLTIAFIVVLLAAISVAYFKFVHVPKKIPTTTTTVMPIVNMHNITNCTIISQPGSYYLIRNIFTKIRSGACIDIASSNVLLEGNGNQVKGSGPYALVAPYSYGIVVSNVSNVTIEDISVSNFSYGVLLDRSNNAKIDRVNASINTMSNLFLFNATNSLITNSTFLKSSSKQGGIYLLGGGGNLFKGDSSGANLFYGLVINSTGNRFYGDSLFENPVDLLCNGSSGFIHNNEFAGSCTTNYYCDFASCSKTNLPTNFTNVLLAPGNVYYCGSIAAPGNYYLASNISLGDFVNLSNPLTSSLSCITIRAPDVNFSCNNHSISNAGTGINITSIADKVSDCVLQNDLVGIKGQGPIKISIVNTRIKNASDSGILLENASGGLVKNVSVNTSNTGIYLLSTSGIVFDQLNLVNNTYGVYIGSGGGNAFSGGIINHNYVADVYCSPAIYNLSTNLLQAVKCGVTDCTWASCQTHVLPSLKLYPIAGCQAISRSGNYSLMQNVVASGDCFKIEASNVHFNCNNKLLSGFGSGTAFTASNVSNVSIANCSIYNFAYGIRLSNTSNIDISNISINSVSGGVYSRDSSLLTLNNVKSKNYSSYGFYVSNTLSGVLSFDSAESGLSNATGFVLTGFKQGIVSFDTALKNPAYGFAFINFTNNTVYNNTAFSNTRLDYYCSPDSSGLYANKNGVNSGNTKNICRWLVLLPLSPVNPPCEAVSTSSFISLKSDFLYTNGGTCFSIYNTNSTNANYSVINCNGHTVLATNGGTFVNIVNSSNVKVENCFFKNFTSPVVSHGNYTNIINNTFGMVRNAITLYGAYGSVVKNNNITNASYGIFAKNTVLAQIINNSFDNVNNSIIWNGGKTTKFIGNKAAFGIYGLIINNSTADSLENNRFVNMSSYGIACYGLSANQSSANLDLGDNTCSSNYDCHWIISNSCRIA